MQSPNNLPVTWTYFDPYIDLAIALDHGSIGLGRNVIEV